MPPPTDGGASGDSQMMACTGECKPGDTKTDPCPWGAPAKETCSASCAWMQTTTCDVPKGWRPIAPSTSAGIAGRTDGLAWWTGDRMLVVGGGDASWGFYDPKTNTWTAGPAIPVGGAYVFTGSALVSIGGDGNGAIYDLKAQSWKTFPSTGYPIPYPYPWGFAFATFMPSTDEVIVWGGYQNKSCPCELSNGAAYDVVQGKWRAVAASPLAARDYYRPPVAIWDGSRVVVYGGGTVSGGRYNDAAAYDPKTDTWESLPQAPLSGYTNVLSQPLQGPRAILWGGDRFGGNAYNYPSTDGAIWDPSNKMWAAVPGVTGEGGLEGPIHGVSWSTGTAFCVWGGKHYNNGFALSDKGYCYDGMWSDLPTNGAPSPREGSSAVWTGTEAIVWAGSKLADGAIYRP